MGPREVLPARLQQVRDELGSGAAPAISKAAVRGGFDHLGRCRLLPGFSRRVALGDPTRTAAAIRRRMNWTSPEKEKPRASLEARGCPDKDPDSDLL